MSPPHPDPTETAPRGPRRTARFNGLVVALVALLMIAAGIYVWVLWSRDGPTAADNARAHPVQPAELPQTRGAPSPEGAEATP